MDPNRRSYFTYALDEGCFLTWRSPGVPWTVEDTSPSTYEEARLIADVWNSAGRGPVIVGEMLDATFQDSGDEKS